MGSALLVSPSSLSFSLCLARASLLASLIDSFAASEHSSLLAVFVVFALSNHEWICKPSPSRRAQTRRKSTDLCWQSYRETCSASLVLSLLHPIFLFSVISPFRVRVRSRREVLYPTLQGVCSDTQLTFLCAILGRLTK